MLGMCKTKFVIMRQHENTEPEPAGYDSVWPTRWQAEFEMHRRDKLGGVTLFIQEERPLPTIKFGKDKNKHTRLFGKR